MRETEYKEIDGVKYLCNMLPGDEAIELEIELIQRIGRPAAAMMSRAFIASPEAKSMADLGTSVEGLVAGGVSVFLNELTPKEALEYCRRLMNGVRAEGVTGDLHDPKVFAEHFRGRPSHAFSVAQWSMEVNFRDFFSESLSHPVVAGLVGAIKSVLSVQTPTRSSGESSSRQTVSMTQKPTEEHKPG